MEHSHLSRRTFLTASSTALAAGAASAVSRPSGSAEREPSPDGPAALGTGLKQSNEGVVYHRDVHNSNLMQGFPPPQDRRVTIDNWSDTTDALRWTHLNAAVVFKSLPVERGDGPVWVLPRRMLDPEKLDRAEVLWGKTKQGAKRISVADWLRRSETDALVVLHDGHIVAEQYFGAMTPYTPHLLWSASKSVLASVIAPLLSDGTLDERSLATQYVPELSQSGLAGATIRELLDMYTEVHAPCFPSPAEIGTTDPATLRQWTVGTPECRRADNLFARMLRVQGTYPRLPSEEPLGWYEFLLTLGKRDPKHGKYFYYTDPHPMALQWILERTTQLPYVEHVGHLLHRLGAERNGSVILDAIGTAVGTIGLSLTARDFARWGLMLCNRGRVGGGKVVPGIEHFFDDIRRNPGPERWSERTNAVAWTPANSGYRSLMWTMPAEQGREPIPFAGGARYQKCYIDATNKYVVAKFSSFAASKPGRPPEDQPPQNEVIAMQSFVEYVLPEFVR